jgi:predicted phage baseplate assembly protein
VRDFAHSGPDDRHYRLDPVAGEVSFGPEVRHADGELRNYGAVPPLGSRLSMSAYRVGGGRRGNVARGVIRVLKSSVPYVTQVENRHPAAGGVDGETMNNAKLRGPLELRASGRAVTADDFEVLARDVAPDAARVACLPATSAGAAASGTAALPGAVRLLVVPRVVTDELGRIAFDDLRTPPRELLRRISDHLDQRRLVGTRLVVEPPFYQGVTVVARVTAGPDARAEAVQDAALRALYAHLSPQDGGADGRGWPFGRAVRAFDISAVLARVPGLAEVDDLLLFPADPASGTRGAPVPRIDLAPGALVYSYQHQVRVQG